MSILRRAVIIRFGYALCLLLSSLVVGCGDLAAPVARKPPPAPTPTVRQANKLPELTESDLDLIRQRDDWNQERAENSGPQSPPFEHLDAFDVATADERAAAQEWLVPVVRETLAAIPEPERTETQRGSAAVTVTYPETSLVSGADLERARCRFVREAVESAVAAEDEAFGERFGPFADAIVQRACCRCWPDGLDEAAIREATAALLDDGRPLATWIAVRLHPPKLRSFVPESEQPKSAVAWPERRRLADAIASSDLPPLLRGLEGVDLITTAARPIGEGDFDLVASLLGAFQEAVARASETDRKSLLRDVAKRMIDSLRAVPYAGRDRLLETIADRAAADGSSRYLPMALAAWMHKEIAWDARGGGFIGEVPQNGIDTFRERLELSTGYLAIANRLMPESPIPAANLIEIAAAVPDPIGGLTPHDWLHFGLSRQRDYPALPVLYMNYVRRMWGGSIAQQTALLETLFRDGAFGDRGHSWLGLDALGHLDVNVDETTGLPQNDQPYDDAPGAEAMLVALAEGLKKSDEIAADPWSGEDRAIGPDDYARLLTRLVRHAQRAAFPDAIAALVDSPAIDRINGLEQERLRRLALALNGPVGLDIQRLEPRMRWFERPLSLDEISTLRDRVDFAVGVVAAHAEDADEGSEAAAVAEASASLLDEAADVLDFAEGYLDQQTVRAPTNRLGMFWRVESDAAEIQTASAAKTEEEHRRYDVIVLTGQGPEPYRRIMLRPPLPGPFRVDTGLLTVDRPEPPAGTPPGISRWEAVGVTVGLTGAWAGCYVCYDRHNLYYGALDEAGRNNFGFSKLGVRRTPQMRMSINTGNWAGWSLGGTQLTPYDLTVQPPIAPRPLMIGVHHKCQTALDMAINDVTLRLAKPTKPETRPL